MKLTLRSGALAVAAASMVFAACGGGEEEPAPSAEEPAQEATPTPEAPAAEESPSTETAAAEGEQIFTQNCGSCHTLEAAGANGQVGPNLDDIEPEAEEVSEKVLQGGGGMPSFEGQLTPEEIGAVSEYVAEVAGG